MALSSTGLSRTYHLAPVTSDVGLITLSRLPIPPTCGVSQGSVLGLLLFIMYTPRQYSYLFPFLEPPPLCRQHPTVFLILPTQLRSSITNLQNALQHISSWMTASLLTLDSPKTEFILVGRKKQLDKICTTPHFTLPTLLATSDEHLTFSDQISAISKAC